MQRRAHQTTSRKPVAAAAAASVGATGLLLVLRSPLVSPPGAGV